ncbi:FAD dependent oxidoreductase [Prosthecobacter fusiformis]|uniref:FAD dependent oxidoreductase n=1 Tax=Prosthecobacter fusiformis TaxID=48464 RepID=A0A4R7RPL9_9BACT|nr:FAD-dependent oxidoreductase [Prosthecobacter fusiformis]TDU66197.1 FAD dependent oxidoreductase [Prosthecobacter fusiformis]
MIRRYLLTCLLSFFTALSAFADAPQEHSADIIVYGDSPSAIMAAIEVADGGQKVLLVSPVQHLGGIIAEGLGNQDVDKRAGNGEPVGGLAREFFVRIARAHDPRATEPRYRFRSSIAEKVMDDWLAEKKIPVLRSKRISEAPGAVVKEDGRITSFLCEDGTRISGKVFIDGTVEGDLMAFSGVSYAWGREGNAKYGETVGGVINPTLEQQFRVKVDPYKTPGDPSSGTIVGVQNEEVGEHGAPDKSAMGFCFRLPLTKDDSNKIAITAPEGYQSSDYEIYRRFLAAGGMNDWLNGPGSPSTDPKKRLVDLGSWHELSANFYGRNHGYPNGSYSARKAIYDEHRRYTQGLIYFLSTDASVPEKIRQEWSQWGLCADEFTDNGGWPRMLYLRSTRRMVSDYVITEADVLARPRESATGGTLQPTPPVDDPIGICWWFVDLHAARTVIRDGHIYNEGAFINYQNYAPFGIPYRAIVPKRSECTNLLVPSALSASYAGYGAIRLEWTFMVLGQSAGAAAVMALEKDCAVQDVPYPQLQQKLLERGQKIVPPLAE